MDNKENSIQQLVYEAHSGNIEARNKLIDYYTKSVIKIVDTKYNDENLIKEDLIQAGIDGIIYALDNYKKDSKSLFLRYVKAIIQYKLFREYKFQQNINIYTNESQIWATKMLEGDSNAKEHLINYYIKQTVRLVETKYNNTNCDKEDLIQAGCIGIAIAIKNYNETYDSKFAPYVYRKINFFITKELEKQNKNSNNKVNEIFIKDIYCDFISDIENKELIKKGFNKLNNRYQEILVLYLYRNYSYEEISKIYNISKQRVEQIYKKSIEIIKEEVTGKKVNKK